ncbi:MAG: O-antigen ligase family protein [Chitinophagaceae bacterium]|nr:O-antigen ligase family protein [Chitinophagaceae bacterium]
MAGEIVSFADTNIPRCCFLFLCKRCLAGIGSRRCRMVSDTAQAAGYRLCHFCYNWNNCSFLAKQNDRYLQYAHDFKTTIFHKNFNEHLIATYRLKDVSTAERFYRWIAGVRMIKDNPVIGFGPGSFYPNYKEYTVPAFKTWVSNNKDHSTVHNYFLLLAVEQGLPGLFFFLLLTGAMLFLLNVFIILRQPLSTKLSAC